MTVLPLWSQAIYAVSAVNMFLIALLFYRGKDGRLRQLFIALFLVLGVVSSFRCFERYVGPVLDQQLISLIAGLPVMIMTTTMTVFLYRHYK